MQTWTINHAKHHNTMDAAIQIHPNIIYYQFTSYQLPLLTLGTGDGQLT